jgi:hypothetical protein
MTKGIEIKELIVGTGDEATKESIVAVNVREFLRRGDEVSHSPLFGARDIIDLGRRECIAGLRYGIPGMRIGGIREILISPHLAYGKAGIPGLIPANALLRCEVELLEIRAHSGLLSQDWLPGKALTLSHHQKANDQQQEWAFTMHESGNSRLTLKQTSPTDQHQKPSWSQHPISLDAEESAGLIRQATGLPTQIPADCVAWNSGFIDRQKNGSIIKDNRNGALCMVIEVRDSGTDICMFGVHEDSPGFLKSPFYQTIERLIGPHLGTDPALPTEKGAQS